MNMDLFYPNDLKSYLMGYTNKYYLSYLPKQNICSYVVAQQFHGGL